MKRFASIAGCIAMVFLLGGAVGHSSSPEIQAPLPVTDALDAEIAAAMDCAYCQEFHSQCMAADPDSPHALINGPGDWAPSGSGFICFGSGGTENCASGMECPPSDEVPDLELVLAAIDNTNPQDLPSWIRAMDGAVSFYPERRSLLVWGCDGTVRAVRELSEAAIIAIEADLDR